MKRDNTKLNKCVLQTIGMFMLFVAFSLLGCSIPSSKSNYIKKSENTLHLNNTLVELEGQRVIFIGEAHTSEKDHAVQLEIIRRLKEDGKKVAIALEMFPNTLQPTLNAWVRRELEEAKFREAYHLTWTVPYSYYSKIFRYARDNKMPLIGINIDPSYIDYIKTYGIENVSQKTLKRIKYISCPEEAKYTADLKLFFGSIGHIQDFNVICGTLRFREAFMAYNLSRSLVGNDYTVVVLLGAIHALKFAVPEMLERHSDESYKVLVPKRLIKHMGQFSIKEHADLTW